MSLSPNVSDGQHVDSQFSQDHQIAEGHKANANEEAD
jgi:hypothetical protein